MPRFPKPVALMLLSVLTASVVGACSSTDPLGPVVGVSIDARRSPVLPTTLRVEIGTTSAALHADATSMAAQGRMHVFGYGTKPVMVTLLGSQWETLATVSFTEDLQPGYDYGIGGFVSRSRPLGLCYNNASAVARSTSPGDTLFVLYGGVPKGAVC